LLLVLLGLAVVAGGCAEEGAELEPKEEDTIYQHVEGWEALNLAQAIESPHPYLDRMSKEDFFTVRAPAGSSEMRVLFDRLAVEKDYDQVRIYDAQGNLIQELTGLYRGWSETIPGDVAHIALESDDSVVAYGFKVKAVQFRRAAIEGEWTPFVLGSDEQAHTAHPYANNARQKWSIVAPPEAKAVRVKFSEFVTERGYDFVHVYDGQGVQAATYTGNRGPFVSVEVPGNVLTVELVADRSKRAHGFDIVEYEAILDVGGCRSDDECGEDQACRPVQCIRAPCPSQCVPAERRSCEGPQDCAEGEFCEVLRCLDGACGGRCVAFGPGTPQLGAAACDDAGLACADGLRCVEDLGRVEGSQGVCGEAAWDGALALRRPVATAHPYADGLDERFEVRLPEWVERFALNVSGFSMEEGYDYAYLFPSWEAEDVSAAREAWTGAKGDFTSEIYDGSFATVRVVSDESVSEFGFEVQTARAQGIPSELVLATYEPQLCQPRNNPKGLEDVRAFLEEEHGLTLYGLRAYKATDATCKACQCSSGQRYVFALRGDDAERYLREVPLLHKGLVRDGEAVEVGERARVVTLAPKQCGDDPWHRWATAQGLEWGEEPALLREYVARSFGASILYSWSERTSDYVCRACQCARGDTVHLVIQATDEQLAAMAQEGWTAR
jgi:hypothetical protein